MKAADHIYGHDLSSIKGKTIWSSSEQVKIPMSSIPPDLMAKYQGVILTVDVMFVNKIPFFITMLHDITFNTIEMLGSQTNKCFLASIQQVLKKFTMLKVLRWILSWLMDNLNLYMESSLILESGLTLPAATNSCWRWNDISVH